MSILDRVTHSYINIDITDKCPLKCPLCARQSSAWFLKQSKEISVEDFKKISSHFQKLVFCGQLSDPIYHSDFEGILEQCTNNDVSIHTAGQGKSRAWWDNILDVSMFNTRSSRWVFGLDGLPKDSHKYRINQNGEKVWETMKFAAEKFKHTNKHQVVWQYIVFKYNENDIEEAKQMALDHGITFELLFSNRWNEYNTEYIPTNPEYFSLNERKRT